jgi:trehalose utilization protein
MTWHRQNGNNKEFRAELEVYETYHNKTTITANVAVMKNLLSKKKFCTLTFAA